MHPLLALYRRNAWATEGLLEFSAGRPGLGEAGDDVYGGIEPMFNHIVSSETGYLRLVTGELPEDRVVRSNPRPMDGLLAPARWLAGRWVSALEMDRDPELVLSDQRGDDPELMADWVPMVQAVHHGDDHRNQVATLLTRQGVEPPNLSGWAFMGEPAPPAGATRDWWPLLLRRFFGHHLWASERLLDHCRGLSEAELALSAPGTYGSIAATLEHLATSDDSYRSTLTEGGWLEYLDSSPDFEVLVRRSRYEAPAWAVVLQAIHHGNDHRTHVGTVLLHHHLAAPDIDVWSYAETEGALRPLPEAPIT